MLVGAGADVNLVMKDWWKEYCVEFTEQMSGVDYEGVQAFWRHGGPGMRGR